MFASSLRYSSLLFSLRLAQRRIFRERHAQHDVTDIHLRDLRYMYQLHPTHTMGLGCKIAKSQDSGERFQPLTLTTSSTQVLYCKVGADAPGFLWNREQVLMVLKLVKRKLTETTAAQGLAHARGFPPWTSRSSTMTHAHESYKKYR